MGDGVAWWSRVGWADGVAWSRVGWADGVAWSRVWWARSRDGVGVE